MYTKKLSKMPLKYLFKPLFEEFSVLKSAASQSLSMIGKNTVLKFMRIPVIEQCLCFGPW